MKVIKWGVLGSILSFSLVAQAGVVCRQDFMISQNGNIVSTSSQKTSHEPNCVYIYANSNLLRLHCDITQSLLTPNPTGPAYEVSSVVTDVQTNRVYPVRKLQCPRTTLAQEKATLATQVVVANQQSAALKAQLQLVQASLPPQAQETYLSCKTKQLLGNQPSPACQTILYPQPTYSGGDGGYSGGGSGGDGGYSGGGGDGGGN